MSGPARALAPAEHEAFRLARLVAAESMPYFMHALFAAAPLAAPGLGTFAVDRAWRLYLDPDLLTGRQAWDPQTAGAVLLHEVGHLLRDHAGRADALARPLAHLEWNLAADAEINDDLLAAGAALPAGAVTPGALGCEDGGLAEDYYAALAPAPGARGMTAGGGTRTAVTGATGDTSTNGTGDTNSSAGGGAGGEDGGDGPGCGSGAGCPPGPGELGEQDSADAPGIGAAEGDLVRRRVAQEVRSGATGPGRGALPAGLQRWAARVLAPPTVAWERVLRAAVRRAVADRAGRSDYTYSRPSRRTVAEVVTPAMRGPAVAVSIVVDTSGSIRQRDLDAAMGEVQGVLRSSGVARHLVRVVSCDAAATTAQRVTSVASVRLAGGGGTDMRVGIAAAEAARPAPHVVVVLTDGDTPWPQRPTAAHLVCAVIGTGPVRGTPAWASTVHVPPLP